MSYYSITTVTNLKTSKKQLVFKYLLQNYCSLFALCWNLEMINFALYSSEDLKNWMGVLIPRTLKNADCNSFNEKSFKFDTNRSSGILSFNY